LCGTATSVMHATLSIHWGSSRQTSAPISRAKRRELKKKRRKKCVEARRAACTTASEYCKRHCGRLRPSPAVWTVCTGISIDYWIDIFSITSITSRLLRSMCATRGCVCVRPIFSGAHLSVCARILYVDVFSPWPHNHVIYTHRMCTTLDLLIEWTHVVLI